MFASPPLRSPCCRKLLPCLLLGFGVSISAHAAYPDRPVTVIVGSTPGGALDLFARALTQKLSESTQQPFIVENRAGVAGNIAAATVSKAKPDGYTVLFAIDTTLTVNPSLYKTLPFDPEKSFETISVPVTYGQMLAVGPNSPAKTLPEFMALAKKQDGQRLSYGSGGTGSPSHLTYASFLAASGLDLLHVPYKASGPAVLDTMGGQVNSVFAVTQAVLPHVNAGKLHALAVSSATRSPLAKDVPTIAESGFPDYNVEFAYAIVAPANTPSDVVNWFSKAVNEVIASPAMQDQLRAWDYVGTGLTPEQSAQWLADTRGKWAGVIKQAGIQIAE